MKRAKKKTRVVKCGPCWAWIRKNGRLFLSSTHPSTPLLVGETKRLALRLTGEGEQLIRVVGLVVEDLT